jgi:hypothetical protein
MSKFNFFIFQGLTLKSFIYVQTTNTRCVLAPVVDGHSALWHFLPMNML